MNVNIFIAFTAGIVSFLSPCIFPVIPSYLTYIGGLSLNEIQASRKSRIRLFLNSLLFVVGFTLIFTILGVFFSGVGVALSGAAKYINMGAGVIVIILGLNFIFDFWKILNLEKKFHFNKKPGGAIGSVLLGMAFGAGWTPCIGPILATILFLASGSGSVGRGAGLLLVYSAGLGLPFIIAGLFIVKFQKLFARVRKYLHAIKIGSGIFLVFIGILIFSGRLARINIFLFRVSSGIESLNAEFPIAAAIVSGLIFFIPAVFIGLSFVKRVNQRNAGVESEAGLEVEEQVLPKFPKGRLIFTVLFLVISILSFAGVLDIGSLLSSWLTFQGI
ncbi:MAG: cytochrome c biogenesis protein CcdA [Candidatus Brocadiales bacterium]|nr:cytochrome c biogenesis protein CcdA [Candidatus Brocadiales bacterium]MBL7007195.1 cytochrome c biogenesis protein CcdA [Spirochaetia bacterium]